MKTALMVIDVQQGLCEGPWAVHDVPGLIARVNAAIAKAHAAKVPVIFIQHEEPEGLVYQSEAWRLAKGLDASASDQYSRKTACDAFAQTALHSQLEQQGITQLVACGLQTEFCVDTTVRRAVSLGYPVTLLSDAHSTMNTEALSALQIIAHHNATLSGFSCNGAHIELKRVDELQFS